MDLNLISKMFEVAGFIFALFGSLGVFFLLTSLVKKEKRSALFTTTLLTFLLGLACLLASGIYMVRQNEVGIKERFGIIEGHADPGYGWEFPWVTVHRVPFQPRTFVFVDGDPNAGKPLTASTADQEYLCIDYTVTLHPVAEDLPFLMARFGEIEKIYAEHIASHVRSGPRADCEQRVYDVSAPGYDGAPSFRDRDEVAEAWREAIQTRIRNFMQGLGQEGLVGFRVMNVEIRQIPPTDGVKSRAAERKRQEQELALAMEKNREELRLLTARSDYRKNLINQETEALKGFAKVFEGSPESIEAYRMMVLKEIATERNDVLRAAFTSGGVSNTVILDADKVPGFQFQAQGGGAAASR